MIKGTLYIDSEVDAERLITLLAKNDYTVQIKKVFGFDAFCTEFEIKYKRKDEDDYDS